MRFLFCFLSFFFSTNIISLWSWKVFVHPSIEFTQKLPVIACAVKENYCALCRENEPCVTILSSIGNIWKKKQLQDVASVLAWQPHDLDNQLSNILAVASCNNDINLWDVDEQKCLHNFQGHSDTIYALAWHPQKMNVLVSGANDGSIKVWDTSNTKKPLLAEYCCKRKVTALAWSLDGKFLAVIAENVAKKGGEVTIFLFKDNNLAFHASHQKHKQIPTGIFFITKTQCISVDAAGDIVGYDVEKKDIQFIFHMDDSEYSCLSYNKNIQVLALGRKNIMELWKRKKNDFYIKGKSRIITHASDISSIQSYNNSFFTLSLDGTIKQWDIK